jgi:hypothetical protein
MIIRSTVLAIILFFGSLSIAAAQSSSTAVGTFTKGSASNTDAITSAAVIGWNYFHPVACTTWAGTFAMITNDNTVWYTTDMYAIATLTPACQTGNVVAFHVVSGSAWDQVFVWPVK